MCAKKDPQMASHIIKLIQSACCQNSTQLANNLELKQMLSNVLGMFNDRYITSHRIL